jgi:TRAP transporter 4TM/12TM fusion protein
MKTFGEKLVSSINKPLSCFLSLFTIAYGIMLFATGENFTACALPIAIAVLLINGLGKEKKNLNIKAMIILIISFLMLAAAVYFWIEHENMIVYRAANYNHWDYFWVFLMIPLVVYLAFKTLGAVFGTIISLPFLLIAFGPYLPYPLKVSKISFMPFVAIIGLEGGILGPLAQAMATYVGIFVVFSSVVAGFGFLDSMIMFFIKLLGKHQVFFPQVATISSMCFGSFSGSAVANVAGTGVFTIPMMKMKGMRPQDAAAVETVASTGGAIMPPIMGAGAFIMAELLGISYVKIMAAAILPALVYYVATFINVHWVRLKQLRQEGQEEKISEDDRKAFDAQYEKLKSSYDSKKLFAIVAAVIVLLYFLLSGVSILVSGVKTVLWFCLFAAVVFFWPLLMALIEPSRRTNSLSEDLRDRGKSYLKATINALNEAGKGIAEMIILGAALGIISTTLLRTGLLYRMGTELIDLALGNIYLLLACTLFISVLLGMAISALATYLLVAPLVVTGFKTLGVEPLTTHMIVFCASVLAPLTPPIAPAAAVAAKLARASFLQSCLMSLKIAQALYMLPIIILQFPSILKLDFFAFLFMIGSTIFISVGTFVDSRWGRWIVFLVCYPLGVSMLFAPYPFYVQAILTGFAFFLLVVAWKNKAMI